MQIVTNRDQYSFNNIAEEGMLDLGPKEMDTMSVPPILDCGTLQIPEFSCAFIPSYIEQGLESGKWGGEAFVFPANPFSVTLICSYLTPCAQGYQPWSRTLTIGGQVTHSNPITFSYPYLNLG